MSGFAALVAVALLIAAALTAARWTLTEPRALPPAVPERVGQATVSVVVPARDEARSLPALLASLGDLHGAALAEIVVVDDGSTDGTAAVAGAGGARVVVPGEPPAGWTGKAWACHVGAESTASDLVLFLDADVTLSPDALARLLAAHEQRGGLVTVQPHHDVVRPHEQLSAYFNVVAVMASGSFAGRTADPPMAFGPCLLTSRADLAAAGGHAGVRGEVLDDAQLAAAYYRAGLPVTGFLGGDAVRMRSYPDGPGQLVAGWTKNIVAGAATAPGLGTLATVLWVCVHHAVAVGALLSLVDVVVGRGGSLVAGPPEAWGVAYAVVAGHLRSLLRHVGAFRWWAWAVYPLPLLAFDLVFARSAAHTVVRRSVQWRGRDVDLRASGQTGSNGEAV